MTTGVLCPTPILQFFDNAGNPAVGGSVRTTIGGGDAATYQDVGLGTPLPNPIPLNSRGEVSTSVGASSQCFLTPNVVYTFTLSDAQGNQLWVASYLNGIALTQDSVGAVLYPYDAVLDGGVVPADDDLHFPYGDVRRFGVVGNGVIDDTLALNTMGGATWTQNTVAYFPPGLTCHTTDTVTFPSPYIAVMMDSGSKISYAGTATKPCLVLGNTTEAFVGRDFNVSVIFENNANDYASQDCVGVKMIGAWAGCRVRLDSAIGFTVNWQLYADNDGGMAYTTYSLGISANAAYHLDFHNISSNGFINENLFLNGDFQTLGTYAVNAAAGQANTLSYGIIFRNEPGGYFGNNKNLFVKPCFQLYSAAASADRIPIFFSNNGGLNQFQSCRFEGTNGELVRIASDIEGPSDNTIDIGYVNLNFGNVTQYMTETDGGKSSGNAMTQWGRPLTSSYFSGDLMQKAFAPTSTTFAVLGMFSQAAASGTETPSGTGHVGKDYILVAPNVALGTYVDTTFYKNFRLQADCYPGRGGRPTFVAYDSSGNIITGTRAVMFGNGPTESSSWGGHAYGFPADTNLPVVFRVDSGVAYIKILFAGSTNQCMIRSFSLIAYATQIELSTANNGLSVYGGQFVYKNMLFPAIPTKLGPVYSYRGDEVGSTVATTGAAQGWQCNLDGYNAQDWVTLTAYKFNQIVNHDTGKIYVCVAEGTTGGTGPTGTSAGIVDGTVTWNYVGTPLATWTLRPSNP